MKALNGVMMQYFHWYSPGDGTHWDDAAARAGELAAAGFTGVWLPPAYKGIGGGYDVGYGVYDMVGNLHEWTNDPEGTFLGGYYLDIHQNGDGCDYRTGAHAVWYHDYSTGFRCCADPAQ